MAASSNPEPWHTALRADTFCTILDLQLAGPLSTGSVSLATGRYALGDLMEMAGYGLLERSATNLRVSGIQSHPDKVLSCSRLRPT